MAHGDIKGLLLQLNEKLEASAPGILKQFPLEKYKRLLEERDKFSGYRACGDAIASLCSTIKEQYGIVALGLYNRNLLIHLIAESNVKYASFPGSVQSQYNEEFDRIASELNLNPTTWYSWDEDLFCKDLAICSGRMFPAGCLKTEIHAGIPRRTLLNLAPLELIRFTSLIIKLGGFAPFLEIHLDVRYRDGFTPAGWEQALRMVGQCLTCFPEAKGITGASWFFDPNALKISPRLAYLRELIEKHGGIFVPYKSDQRTTELATSKSDTRKRLYESGQYKPVSYIFVWGRKEIQKWLKI